MTPAVNQPTVKCDKCKDTGQYIEPFAGGTVMLICTCDAGTALSDAGKIKYMPQIKEAIDRLIP